MKLARELELRIEKVVEGISAALFRGKMHAVDLANRLIRFIDLSVEEGPNGPQIANTYLVEVNQADIDESLDVTALERELAAAVTETAADKGWRLDGPISVSISAGERIAAGSIRTTPSTQPGPMDVWGQLIDHDGATLELTDNRVVIGRGSNSDLVIGHERVSRRHAIVFRRHGGVWVMDLRSANGTFVNGTRIGRRPASLAPGDSVSLGPATFTLRLL